MAERTCLTCGGPLTPGFVSTSNGSGLYWAHDASQIRMRPKGLEVLVGTGFQGNYSANLPGLRCAKCRSILLSLPKSK
jgi:uncharacterized protein DUF6487